MDTRPHHHSSRSSPLRFDGQYLTMPRQFRVPTGVPRGNRHSDSPQVPSSVLHDLTGDVIMEDAPQAAVPSAGPAHTYAGRVSARVTGLYHDIVGPRLDPAITLVNKSLHCGVKRAADTLSDTCDRVLQEYVETRRSTEDGLIIKRFKRLPIDPAMATSRAQLTNTLPVDLLKALPGDQFRWTNNILDYLGAANHTLVTNFIDGFLEDMKSDNYLCFPQQHSFLDPRSLPVAIAAALKATGKSEKVSIVLHNHMLYTCKTNNDDAFKQSGVALLEKLVNFRLCHEHTYYNGGRIPIYKEHGLKPYGPLKFPYTAVNADPNSERLRLLGHLKFLKFILSHRNAFNQAFPVETFAGIIADLDAIRKDEPPPSYVDWPGKHQRVPGAYPEDDIHKLLFDTVAMRDYKPDRLWDTKHPSPSKDVKFADYSTPLRNAMKKNIIFYDSKGQPRASKAAIRTEAAVGPAKKAHFPVGNPAFYVSSVQVPPQKRHIPVPRPVNVAKPNIPAPVPPARPTTPPRQVIHHPKETWTQREAREAAEGEGLVNTSPVIKKTKSLWKDIDDFFSRESQTAWGKSQPLVVSEEKEFETAVKKQLIEEAEFRTAREAEAEKKRKEDEERKKAEEQQRIKEAERKKAEEKRRRIEEELRAAKEKQALEEDERLAQTGQLRQPRQPIVPSISPEWNEKVRATMRARPNTVLAKTPEAADLTRKDFETVIPENQWLNDEIVNGTLMHLANYVNQKAGIKKPNLQTPKCHVFNSFVGKNLVEGKGPSERLMRRAGVKKDNFFDIDTLMVPICRGAHWTLLGIRPKHREVFHLDSLNGNGDTGLKKKALLLARAVLGDAFDESDWVLTTIASPHQSNFDDCGVHTITNGICIGLGIDPSSYPSADMPRQRLRVAAVCLNEGFTGDLTLDGT